QFHEYPPVLEKAEAGADGQCDAGEGHHDGKHGHGDDTDIGGCQVARSHTFGIVGTQGPEDENGQGDVRSHPPDTGDDVEEQEALSQARPKSEGFRYGWHGSFLSGVPVRPGFPYGTILTASRVKGLTESSRKPHETLNSLVDRRGLWLRRGDVLTGGLGQQPLLGSDDRA